MPALLAARSQTPAAAQPRTARVLVACPDARPPAYEAVAGLAAAGMLDRFLTGYYYDDRGPLAALARRSFPDRFARVEPRLRRRYHEGIPAAAVATAPAFDVALAVENRLHGSPVVLRDQVARWRTRHFDGRLARLLDRRRPDAALIFSDVGSGLALPLCRQRAIGTVLSMVHGDVREEREVIAREAERSPDFFPIYLADGAVNGRALSWLHERRLRDIDLAERILVPSDHIAGRLIEQGTPADRVRVVPYAADTERFRPRTDRPSQAVGCTFLFAGGITQRKGIKYLLEAWRRVRRPGWRLQLLGGLPADPKPLEPYRDEVEWLGRVGHAEVPAVMAAADVFVSPSLFEGSAVVTYEALACGLPSIVTPEAGSVVRDEVEGLLVPSADVERLAIAMERLGHDAELRRVMSLAARARAEEFTWTRYHAAVIEAALGVARG